MITIKKYTDEMKTIWNEFNNNSKNSLFMFNRNYMDYHKDRFHDFSLMFFDNDKLIALLPLSEHGEELRSHGGLTYGGFITDVEMKQHIMNECFELFIQYVSELGFKKIIYKVIPHIYHKQPAEEDKFALFFSGANILSVDVSTYVNLKSPLKMKKGRKAQISRAKREGVEIKELTEIDDFNTFIELENIILKEKHGVKAVHTGEELKLLHDCFPNEIRLVCATKDNSIIAGTVIYVYEQVVHTQYMVANDEARRIGALDLTINSIIEEYKSSKTWLDFGISTEHNKIYLNDGLCSQKEGFGGRTGVYEIWEINL